MNQQPVGHGAICIVRDRKRSDALDDAPPVLTPLWGQPSQQTPFRILSRATFTTTIALVSGALVIAPIWGLICGGVTFVCCFVLRRPRVIGYAALAVAAYIALVMVHRVTTEHPFANAGWPAKFEDLHRLGMSVVVFLVATVLANQPRATRAGMGSDSNSP